MISPDESRDWQMWKENVLPRNQHLLVLGALAGLCLWVLLSWVVQMFCSCCCETNQEKQRRKSVRKSLRDLELSAGLGQGESGKWFGDSQPMDWVPTQTSGKAFK